MQSVMARVRKLRKKMKVFEINAAVAELKKKAEAGEINPELLSDTLESLEETRNVKLNSVANWVEEDESKIDWLDKKIRQLTTLKKHYTTQSENLKKFLKFAIETSGHDSIQTDNFNLRLSNPPESVIVPDVMQIPIDYVKYPDPKPQANKKLLKKDLKAGKQISGAYLERKRKVIIE